MKLVAGAIAEVTYELLQEVVKKVQDQSKDHESLADRLSDNCTEWSIELTDFLREVERIWRDKGAEEAMLEVNHRSKRLQLQYQKVDPKIGTTRRLAGHSRFERFAKACAEFYECCINLTDELLEEIGQSSERTNQVIGISLTIDRYQSRVKEALNAVTNEHSSY